MHDRDVVAEHVINSFKGLPECCKPTFKEALSAIYDQNKDSLDQKFKKEIETGTLEKIYSCLWELILADKLRSNKDVEILGHKDKGPDWCINSGGSKFYIEAVCAQMPDQCSKSEIHRVNEDLEKNRNSSSGNDLVDEVKSRISGVVSTKIKKHKSLVNMQDYGYILCVSYGAIPLFSSCDLFHAVQTLLPMGPLTAHFNLEGTEGKIFYPYNGSFTKPTTGAIIKSDILLDEKNSWISAILISKVKPLLLFPCAELIPEINWNSKNKNDFVLIHNPHAKHKLNNNIFNPRTEISVNLKKEMLELKGSNIFPSFR